MGQDDEADLALTRAAGRWKEPRGKGDPWNAVPSLPQLTGHQGLVVTSVVGRTPFPAREVAGVLPARHLTLLLVPPGLSFCQLQKQQVLLSGYLNSTATSYVPQCQASGQYAPIQCDVRQEQCWCVDTEGMEVYGTRQPGRPTRCKYREDQLPGRGAGVQLSPWRPGGREPGPRYRDGSIEEDLTTPDIPTWCDRCSLAGSQKRQQDFGDLGPCLGLQLHTHRVAVHLYQTHLLVQRR